MDVYLFSYGTLQLPKVQQESFGRILTGHPDKLFDYRLEQLKITDNKVLQQSGQQFHPIAVVSKNSEDYIEGMLFEITQAELLQADAYEVEQYKRIEVILASGKQGWVIILATINKVTQYQFLIIFCVSIPWFVSNNKAYIPLGKSGKESERVFL